MNYFKLIFLVILFSQCTKKPLAVTPVDVEENYLFDSIPEIRTVLPLIKEVSGIVDSKAFPGNLWAHEDSGNPPQLFLVKHNGAVTKRVHILGAINRDWEEIAFVNDTIYIADIGDNSKVFSTCKIYKITEPVATNDTAIVLQEIEFRYSDGPRDAEAFLVDAATKDIYILSKSDNPSKIYKLTYPYSYTSPNTANPVATLPYSGIVSAAMSTDGKEILVKTYTNVYHYITNGKSIPDALSQEFTKLPYIVEPQGEAVTFANNNSGYFTLSEKSFAADVKLYFYKRN